MNNFDDGSDKSTTESLDPTRPKGVKYDAKEMKDVSNAIEATKAHLSSKEEMIPIENWMLGEIDRLLRFRQHFVEGQRIEPEYYPSLLPNGEWDEQYRVFDDWDLNK